MVTSFKNQAVLQGEQSECSWSMLVFPVLVSLLTVPAPPPLGFLNINLLMFITPFLRSYVYVPSHYYNTVLHQG